MSNAIRLPNGGVIEVRTGVLQGIGPTGPRGLVGIDGPEGPQGADGETGPPGAILQYFSRATVSSTTSLTTNTDTLLAFATVNYDDLDVFASSTAITFAEDGDYMLNAWVRFDLPANAGDSIRQIWWQSTVGGVLARNSCLAVADEATYVSLSWVERISTGTTVHLYGRHSDDLSVGVSSGAVSICRVGSGPQGATGATGAAGPVGPAGPAGPTGATGSASSGFATYADLL